jgi:hypothetical protein
MNGLKNVRLNMLTQSNIFAAYLHLRVGEVMPSFQGDRKNLEDVAADNAAISAWSQGLETLDPLAGYYIRFIERTDQLLSELETLVLDNDNPVSGQYMTLFYDAAKDVFDQDTALIRNYFSWLYLVIFQKDSGPRWGEFVEVYGVAEFNATVRSRFAALI